MGKAYYAGVPGMNERFGPVVSSVVKKSVTRGRQHQTFPGAFVLILTFILAIPVMPFWAGSMMIGETIKMWFNTRKGMPEREEYISSIKFASFFFIVGIIMYNYVLRRYFGFGY